jgi:hypothetical protein
VDDGARLFDQSAAVLRTAAAHAFLSEQISHQQPANSTFLSEQISHQPPAKRTG